MNLLTINSSVSVTLFSPHSNGHDALDMSHDSSSMATNADDDSAISVVTVNAVNPVTVKVVNATVNAAAAAAAESKKDEKGTKDNAGSKIGRHPSSCALMCLNSSMQ